MSTGREAILHPNWIARTSPGDEQFKSDLTRLRLALMAAWSATPFDRDLIVKLNAELKEVLEASGLSNHCSSQRRSAMAKARQAKFKLKKAFEAIALEGPGNKSPTSALGVAFPYPLTSREENANAPRTE